MDTARCRRLEDLNGVRAIRVYSRSGNVVVWYDPRACSATMVIAAIERAAHEAWRSNLGEPDPAHAGDLVRLTVGGVVLAVLALRRLLGRRGAVAAQGCQRLPARTRCSAATRSSVAWRAR
jgi:hypothetical protein